MKSNLRNKTIRSRYRENAFLKHKKSKDFQKNPEEESLASEIGMLEIDEITMKVSFTPLDEIT